MIGAVVSSLQVLDRWNKSSYLECSKRSPILTRRHREIWVQVREEIVRLNHLDDMMFKLIDVFTLLMKMNGEQRGVGARAGWMNRRSKKDRLVHRMKWGNISWERALKNW